MAWKVTAGATPGPRGPRGAPGPPGSGIASHFVLVTENYTAVPGDVVCISTNGETNEITVTLPVPSTPGDMVVVYSIRWPVDVHVVMNDGSGDVSLATIPAEAHSGFSFMYSELPFGEEVTHQWDALTALDPLSITGANIWQFLTYYLQFWGEWTSDTEYPVAKMVLHNGNLYISNDQPPTSNIAQEPGEASNDYWTLLASSTGGSGGTQLTPVSVNANYTANPGDLVVADNIYDIETLQITLPTTPPPGTMAGVVRISVGAPAVSIHIADEGIIFADNGDVDHYLSAKGDGATFVFDGSKWIMSALIASLVNLELMAAAAILNSGGIGTYLRHSPTDGTLEWAPPEIVLHSPGGYAWLLTVDDSGVVTAIVNPETIFITTNVSEGSSYDLLDESDTVIENVTLTGDGGPTLTKYVFGVGYKLVPTAVGGSHSITAYHWYDTDGNVQSSHPALIRNPDGPGTRDFYVLFD